MRIGFFHGFNSFRAKTGYEVHVQEVVAALVKRGHSILTYYLSEDDPGFKNYRRRQLLDFLRDIEAIYIRVAGGYNAEPYSVLKALRLFSVPLVWEVNSPLEEGIVRDNISAEVIKRCNRNRRFWAHLVDSAICVSEELSDYSKDFLGIPKTYIVPNGANPEEFNPGKCSSEVYKSMQGKFKVFWMGRAKSPWHGIDVIFEVAKTCQNIDSEVVFVIVGDVRYIGLPRQDNIFLIDSIEHRSLAPYVASADLCLCLYHNSRPLGNYGFYGSSLKLFEYMACGRPIIATNIGQLAVVIKHRKNGLLTDNNPEDVIEKILYLKNNPEFAKNLGVAARKDIVDFYNWDRVAEQIEEVFLKVKGCRN